MRIHWTVRDARVYVSSITDAPVSSVVQCKTMELPCEPNRVFVEPRWWRFSQRVLQARRIGDRVLVIFDYMEFPNGRPAQNLIAFDLDQKELWRAEKPESGGADAYVMHILRLTQCVGLLIVLGVLTACRTTPLNKEEAADWFATYGSMVRWVGYQGSDQQFHYYIARVMDGWNFVRFRRDELKVDDERPFSKASSAPLYYYLVDPRHGYQKVTGTP